MKKTEPYGQTKFCRKMIGKKQSTFFFRQKYLPFSCITKLWMKYEKTGYFSTVDIPHISLIIWTSNYLIMNQHGGVGVISCLFVEEEPSQKAYIPSGNVRQGNTEI